jgi:hypothetical protein
MHWIQVDNQLPFVSMPVLFCPQKTNNQFDHVLKFSMTMQTNNALDFCVYPYIGVQVSWFIQCGLSRNGLWKSHLVLFFTGLT